MGEPMENELWDLAVIGAGPGGYVAAIRAAQLGLKTLCVDKRPHLGGVCLNEGCIPSKALLESSRLFAEARLHLAEHGILVKPQLDLAAMQARKEKVVTELSHGIAGLFKKYGVTPLQGEACLDKPGEFRVRDANGEKHTLRTRRILLATGSRPASLPLLQWDGERVLHSGHALALKSVPETLLVVGGGAVGLEIGSIWNRLGSRVTVVETLPEILPGVEEDLVRLAKRSFVKQGMEFRTGMKLVGSELDDTGISLMLSKDGMEVDEILRGDAVLVAAGRIPNVEAANAVDLGLALDEQGRFRVNADYQTSQEGVFAIGDLIAGPMLAHRAMAEGVAVAERMAGHPAQPVGAIPAVVYTHPEVASVGLSTRAAEARGLKVKTARFPMLANGRARASGSDEGMVKIVADAESGRLLGIHLVGREASELIALAAAALAAGWDARRLGALTLAHPTLAEALKEAALGIDGQAVHA